jgi:hypothetical protein
MSLTVVQVECQQQKCVAKRFEHAMPKRKLHCFSSAHGWLPARSLPGCRGPRPGGLGHGLVEGDTASLPVPRGVDGR